MADQSRQGSRWTRVLAIGVFTVVMAELATAVAAALAGNVSWANAVGSFTVTNGAMGLGSAAGVRNAEIARRMAIAPKTVANHIAAIFNKLQVADRSQAIILAREAGLGRSAPTP
jgi:hypothetical protein